LGPNLRVKVPTAFHSARRTIPVVQSIVKRRRDDADVSVSGS
jgi:hypothetical protein